MTGWLALAALVFVFLCAWGLVSIGGDPVAPEKVASSVRTQRRPRRAATRHQ
jgi:hypothetical protein